MKTPGNLTQKLLKNTLYNHIGHGFRIATSLFLTPYIFYRLGAELFGIWAFAAAFVGYFTLLDFGIGAAVVKYTSEFYARSTFGEIRRLILSSLLCYGALGVVFVPVIALRGWITDVFHITGPMRGDFSFVLMITVVSFAVAFVFNVFQYVLRGLQRMDVANKIYMVMTVLNVCGTVAVLEAGYGIRGLVLCALGIQVLTASFNCLALLVIYPWTREGYSAPDITTIRRLLSYGVKIQITGICGLINFQMDKILIGYFLNMTMVGFYEIGAKIAGFIREIPMMLFSAIMPAVAELDAREDRERLRTLYFRSSKYLVTVAMPLAGIIIACAPTIVRVWINAEGQGKAVLAVILLSIGYFFNIMTGVVTAVARGIARPEYEMKATSAIAASNLVLSVVLILAFGYPGVLMGTVFALVIGNSGYLYYFHTAQIRQPWTTFLGGVMAKPFVATVLASLMVWAGRSGLNHYVQGFGQSRMLGAAFLAAGGIAFGCVYFAVLFRMRHLTGEDLGLLRKIRL